MAAARGPGPRAERREGSTPSQRTKESEPVREPGLAANECAPIVRGLRLLRSPLWKMKLPGGSLPFEAGWAV